LISTSTETDIFCPACGYNLRGTDSAQCGECGLAIDRTTIGASVLPWAGRLRVGGARALFRTIHLIFRKPSFAAGEVAAPMRPRDAQWFRLWVVVLAGLPLAVAVLVLRALDGAQLIAIQPVDSSGTVPLPWWIDFVLCFLVGLHSWPVPTIAIFLALMGMTGAASYVFDIRDGSLTIPQRNRAVIMSYYTAAPLSLLVISITLIALALAMRYYDLDHRALGFNVHALLLIFAAFCLMIILGGWYYGTLRILDRTTHCSRPRLIGSAILLPILWLLLLAISLIAFPLLCGYIKLLVLSHLD
jgi:hypothetical protein